MNTGTRRLLLVTTALSVVLAGCGTADKNMAPVHEYLLGHGVDAGQLSTRGYRESNPVASNATKKGRAKNRRVEVRPAK